MTKNLYDVLGASPQATPEEIRKCYLLRSKMMHPDRFDPVAQKAEWELANELLKELNHAYSVLRDPRSRGQYDGNVSAGSYRPQSRTQTASRSAPGATSAPRSEAPPPSAKMGPLKAGAGLYHVLPRTTQRRLVERVAGRNKVQHAIKLGGVEWSYVWAAGLCVWIYFLFHSALKSHWDADSRIVLAAITGIVALIQGFNVSTIVRWHASQLGHWLFITPLYIIRTHFEEVRYWPIWEVSRIRGTHNYRNGVYQDTSLEMNFTSGHERVTIAPEEAYDEILSALRTFDEKARNAKFHENWAYFVDQDDFRECKPGQATTSAGNSWRRTVLSFAGVFAGWALVFYGANFLNHSSPFQMEITEVHAAPISANASSAPDMPVSDENGAAPTPRPRVQRSLPPSRPFSEPVIPTPPTGEVRLFSREEALAPLEIRSTAGTNYLVKITDPRFNKAVMSVFVRGGESIKLKVPIGAFEIRYAWGDTWYGYKYLFGPKTLYTKADRLFNFQQAGDELSGYTISLYKIPEGVLSTESIHPEEF